MAYLMDFAQGDFAQQQQKLEGYSKEHPHVFEYHLLKKEQEITRHWQANTSVSQLSYKLRQRVLFTYWQMSSYTALSSLSIHEAPELPVDKAREDIFIEPEPADQIVYDLPRGAHTGNIIHDLLENIPFKQLAEGVDISAQRNKSCLRYGLKLNTPELIDQLLTQTVSTLLLTENTGFKLSDLEEQQCLKEMPFYLSMKEMDASLINHVLKDCPAYQPLSEKRMKGYLTGFIDLICEYQGRFYIMDYKSNGLETYDKSALTHAMRDHNYGLQYWIYSLVLNKYLAQRLPDYSYEKHFGGVMYLFVRGMDESHENSGVYWDKPALEKLEQLEALFI
jgi:exodeoxyribonuclease V beta subunit